MGRILAIDYGTKRVGLAVTDPMQIIATALTTVDTPKAMDFICTYVRGNAVEKILVGYPTDDKGNLPDIEIIRRDESFSSRTAVKTLIQSGVKKKERRNKALIDSVAATVILQEYLQNI
jgi:putative Holliday junction resolvase